MDQNVSKVKITLLHILTTNASVKQ